MSKSLAKNGAFYLVYNILNVIFPFITGIYAAHVLLPGDVGTVDWARNIAQYFVMFSFLGIPTYGLREVARVRDDKEKLNKLASELYVINFLSTMVFLSVYVTMIFAVPAFRAQIWLFLVVGISIAMNTCDITWLYEGLEEFQFITIRNIIFKALSFGVLVLFVHSPDDYLIYAFTTVIGTIGNHLLNMIASRRHVKFSFRKLDLKRHLKPIFILVTVNLALEIQALVDVTMLGAMCPSENVAYYSYARKIQTIIMQIMHTFTIVGVPRMTYLWGKGDKEGFNQIISKTFKLILLLAIPAIIGIWFVAEYAVTLVYTEAYFASAGVLQILSFYWLLSPLGYLLGSRVLVIAKKEPFMTISVGAGAVLNIILNAIMIPLWQERGAAIATIIGEMVVLTLSLCFSKRYFKLRNVVGSVVKILLAGALMGGYLFTIQLFVTGATLCFILQLAGSVLIYALALILMREETLFEGFRMVKNKFARKRAAEGPAEAGAAVEESPEADNNEQS